MEGLLGQLGVDWKLFLSQAVNFFILLLILRAFVYKPLMKVIKERNERIKEGLEKAKESEVRLREVDSIAKERLRKTDLESINIIKNTEKRAKDLEQVLMQKAEEKQKELLRQIQLSHQRQEEAIKQLVSKGAVELVKKFIVKTVELDPKDIDETLIKKAASKINE